MFGLRDLAKIQPIVYGSVIVGCMGGMFAPGYLKDAYGSYRPFLLLCAAYLFVQLCCFVFIFFAHPIGPAGKPKKDLRMSWGFRPLREDDDR